MYGMLWTMTESYKHHFRNELRRFAVDTNWIGVDALRLDRVDPKEFVRLHAEANVNRLFLFFKDHWGYAFYETKIGIRHPHLKGDFCSEVIEEAQKCNISINAYYSIGFDHAIVEKHPDWSIVDVEGKPVSLQHTGNFRLFNMPCYNSPYRKYVLDQLDEIAERYEFHQMTIDILGRMTAPLDYSGTHACYSEHCKTAYREQFGRDLPEQLDPRRAGQAHTG